MNNTHHSAIQEIVDLTIKRHTNQYKAFSDWDRQLILNYIYSYNYVSYKIIPVIEKAFIKIRPDIFNIK